jgi:ABC-type multidrug transport system fused ATPase/permease subunit
MSRHAHLSASNDPSLTAKSRTTWEIVRRVFPYLRPYVGLAVANNGFAVLALACGLAYPALTRRIIDDVVGARRGDLLVPIVAALAAAFALREVFNSLRIRINNVFEQSVIYDMRRDLFAHLQRLPVSYFDARASGDLMTRVIEDVNSLERVLIDGTEQGLVALLSIVGALVILFRTNGLLTALCLAPLPILIGGALWYTLTAHSRYRAQRQAASAMNALLMDSLQGVRQIKAFGRQAHEDARFAQRADDLRRGTLGVMKAWSVYSPAMAFAASLGTALVLGYGGRLVIDGQLRIGQLVEFLLYLSFFYEPVGRLHGLNQMVQAARAGGERVFDILDAAQEPSQRTEKLPATLRGEIRYEQVHFSYGPERVVLKGVTLHAKPGQMVALVGPTGAGKSTLVNLLPAFYIATSGRITIDGLPVDSIQLEALRERISVVSQEPFLFNGTVRENILYGRLDATEEEMVAAARAANCHDFITQLPQGYESRVGERGVKLSVGEKQRVSIARALLKNAPILILDEATASVDTGTERLIQEALERLMKGRTTFVIAHRLSTIRQADQILVIRQGEIVERGTHDELMDLEGVYARLARIQNTTFIEEGFEKLAGQI